MTDREKLFCPIIYIKPFLYSTCSINPIVIRLCFTLFRIIGSGLEKERKATSGEVHKLMFIPVA